MLTPEERLRVNQCISLCLDQVTSEVPDPEPPPPDPPPPSQGCSAGWKTLSGFWQGWCGDELANFVSSGALIGNMRSNAQAYRRLTDGRRYQKGRIKFEYRFNTATVPGTGGGKHLGGPTSLSEALGDGHNMNGWLRPDLTIRPTEIRVHTYNCDKDGNPWYPRAGGLDVVVDIWSPGVSTAVGTWQTIDFAWDRYQPDRIRYIFNGHTHEVVIHPTSFDMKALVVGNVDGLSNFGGDPTISFRGFTVQV